AAGLRIFGPSLAVTRALSFAFTLALIGVVYALVRQRTRDGSLALGAAILFTAPWFVVTWAPMGRVDMLACLLSVAGLWLFPGAEAATGGRRWAAGVCF